MDKLEKYIVSNREQFDIEPAKGHEGRFAARLGYAPVEKRTFRVRHLMQAAAVGLLVVLSTLWTYDKISRKVEDSLATMELSPEIKEAQTYYVSEVNSKYNQISHSTLFHDSIQKNMVLKELRDMDSVYNSLQNDLRASADDPRVVNAMIEHYRMKLEIMNQIIQNLEELQINNKQTDHEKSKI